MVFLLIPMVKCHSIYAWLKLILHLLRQRVDVFWRHQTVIFKHRGKALDMNKQSWFLFSSPIVPTLMFFSLLPRWTKVLNLLTQWLKSHSYHQTMQEWIYSQDKLYFHFSSLLTCEVVTQALMPRSVSFFWLNSQCLFSQPVSTFLNGNIF